MLLLTQENRFEMPAGLPDPERGQEVSQTLARNRITGGLQSTRPLSEVRRFPMDAQLVPITGLHSRWVNPYLITNAFL